MISVSKAEYKKGAFEVEKQVVEYASLGDPYWLDCVFGVSSLNEGMGLLGIRLWLSTHKHRLQGASKLLKPQRSLMKTFNMSVQTFSYRIGFSCGQVFNMYSICLLIVLAGLVIFLIVQVCMCGEPPQQEYFQSLPVCPFFLETQVDIRDVEEVATSPYSVYYRQAQ